MESLFQLIILIVLLALGYFAGTIAEAKHYRSIEEREQNFLNLPAVTIENAMEETAEIVAVKLVTGSAVISVDYFKRFLAALRNIFGGTVASYETLVDRARREAVLRMKEQARTANIIINCRIETAAIGKSANQRNTVGSIEALAYGTAVKYRK